MKLSTKYNLWSLTAAGIIFLVAATISYFSFRELIMQQLDNSLRGEMDEFTEYVQKNQAFPEIEKVFNERTLYEEINKPYQKIKFKTKQKLINQGRDEPVRVIYFGVALGAKYYQVTIMRSLDETKALLLNIVLIAIGTVLLLLLLMSAVNRILFKKIFRPFYQTIDRIEQYQLSESQPLTLDKTSTDEFTLLNEKLNSLSLRINSDYNALKEFSANAAHEMQTPLAVIRNHTDHLLQNESLTRDGMLSLQKIETTIGKLSRLNQSLLLLTRLESNPYAEKTAMNISEKVATKLDDLEEIISAKELTVVENIESFQILMNEQLWEIIINNLLSNAIKYNIANGKIIITGTPKFIEISNTSDLPALDPEKVFTRFFRHPANTQDGTGLGLAITRQAVLSAGFQITYSFAAGLHTYRINFC